MGAHQTQSASWVEKTPDVCGGDACIRNTRITVHGLVEWKKLGLSDAEILESIQGLTQADLQVAWQYYEQNCEEIEQTIREEEEAMHEKDGCPVCRWEAC